MNLSLANSLTITGEMIDAVGPSMLHDGERVSVLLT